MRIDKLLEIFDKVSFKLSHAEQVLYHHKLKNPTLCEVRLKAIKNICEAICLTESFSYCLMGEESNTFQYSSKTPKYSGSCIDESGNMQVERFTSDSAAIMFTHQLLVKALQMIDNKNPKNIIMPDNSITQPNETYMMTRASIVELIEETKKLLISV